MSKSLHTTVSEEIHAKVNALAKEQDRPVGYWLRKLVEDAVKNSEGAES